MSNRLIGYQSGQGFLYDLSGASKMLFFISLTWPRFVGEIFLSLLRLLDQLLSLIYLWSTFSHLAMVKKFTGLRQLLLKVGGVSI